MNADPPAEPVAASSTDAVLREIAQLATVPPVEPSLRRILRRLVSRDLPDRWLHAWRRRIVRSRLARRGGAGSLLFVCIGNIYRSPYAAAAFTAALPSAFRAHMRTASAGFTGADRGTPPEAIAAAATRGVDLRAHRSALLSPERIARAELIVVMDADQKRQIRGRFGRSDRDVVVLGDLDPLPIRTRGIADPWDQPQEVLEASYDRIQRCARELARALFGG